MQRHLSHSHERIKAAAVQRMLAPYVDETNDDGEVGAWMELGDKHPDFRYTII
jgi:hypothetical protein